MSTATRIRRAARQGGLTTVEYAAAGGLVTAAVIAGFVLLGGNVSATLTVLATLLGGG